MGGSFAAACLSRPYSGLRCQNPVAPRAGYPIRARPPSARQQQLFVLEQARERIYGLGTGLARAYAWGKKREQIAQRRDCELHLLKRTSAHAPGQ